MINKAKELSRYKKQAIMVIVDCILFVGILLASYVIRFEKWFIPADDTLKINISCTINWNSYICKIWNVSISYSPY